MEIHMKIENGVLVEGHGSDRLELSLEEFPEFILEELTRRVNGFKATEEENVQLREELNKLKGAQWVQAPGQLQVIDGPGEYHATDNGIAEIKSVQKDPVSGDTYALGKVVFDHGGPLAHGGMWTLDGMPIFSQLENFPRIIDRIKKKEPDRDSDLLNVDDPS